MDVSIVIVNWNTRDLLRDCLNSIQETVGDIACEVIVVDNASGDQSVAMLEKEFPEVRVIRNSENRGFGAANNQAFAVMNGRYALLLNTDTILVAGAVQQLFSFMEANPEAGMACGQLLNRDGTRQNSIAKFPNLLTLVLNVPLLEYLFPKYYPSKRYKRKIPVQVDSGIGACLIIRKRAIDQAGGFDERYFFFFEETDLALQMHLQGWKVYHVPSAFIYHLQGKSIGRNVRSRIEFYRSRYQFFRKWKNPLCFRFLSVIVITRLILNYALVFAGNLITFGAGAGLRERLSVYGNLILWHLHGCP
ncbi:MAG: glycosyltransferase family 2 protein [Pseudomonadota bacterium]